MDKVEAALTGYATAPNRYAVFTSLGSGGGGSGGGGCAPILYMAEEPPGWFNLHCGGPGRSFSMTVRDPGGLEVGHFFRARKSFSFFYYRYTIKLLCFISCI
jgi:hypothetical protein